MARWVENPYMQYFTGETYFQLDAPLDSSSLTRWRQRLGVVRERSFERVIVDTTVMPKAVAYPTDSRLRSV